MNWLTSRCASLAAVAALALATTSCDTGTALNVDLPDTSAINTDYLDLNVTSGTVRLAPVQTLKANHFLVGRLNDNVVGTTEARAYFNVLDAAGISTVSLAAGFTPTDSLPSSLATGTVTPVLDSVVLVARFDRVYGSATTPAKFDVYNLQAPLDERQVYDSGTDIALGAALGQNLTARLDLTQVQIIKPAEAATATAAAVPAVTAIVPDPTVRLLLQRRNVPASGTQSAIPGVSSAFADNLFTQLKQPNFTQTQLDALLKGLALVPSANHNSNIVSFSKTYKSRLLIYYHADAARRTYSLYFGPAYSGQGLAAARDPRYYTRIITDALPGNLSVLANRAGFVPNALLGGISYAQEGTGLGTRITFQGLDALMNKTGLTINRAEIRVPVKPFSNALFLNPTFLYAVEVDNNNEILQRTINNLPSDRVVQSDGANQLLAASPAFGSITDASTTQAYYSIPVTSYLQAYLGDKLGGNPASLVLIPSVQSTSALTLNRTAIDAPNIKLRVYYSQR
jgi:hypothetical protein